MFKRNNIFKFILTLLFIIASAYSCPIYETPVPMADAYVGIDAKNSKTSFNITWKFKEFFIQSLLTEHDKNKNGKFDKDEQEDIKKELIDYVEANNNITEIVYVEKGQRVRKSLMSKINIIDSGLLFSGEDIKYYYNFVTSFILKEDHRLFIRFLDPKEKVYLNLKDVLVNNYNSKKVIVAQNIRANIYFYEYIAKYRKKKTLSAYINSKDDKHKDHNH